MTVDTNAPERIWADPESHWYTDNQDFKNDGYNEYIRIDLHEAAVRNAREVKVRALVWDDANAGVSLGHEHECATALGGEYHVCPDEDSASGMCILQWVLRGMDFCMTYGGMVTSHTDIDAAKAAAQADYERRIREALE